MSSSQQPNPEVIDISKVKVTTYPFTKINSLGLQTYRHFQKNPSIIPECINLVIMCRSSFVGIDTDSLKWKLLSRPNYNYTKNNRDLVFWSVLIKTDNGGVDTNRFDSFHDILLYIDSLPEVISISNLEMRPCIGYL